MICRPDTIVTGDSWALALCGAGVHRYPRCILAWNDVAGFDRESCVGKDGRILRHPRSANVMDLGDRGSHLAWAGPDVDLSQPVVLDRDWGPCLASRTGSLARAVGLGAFGLAPHIFGQLGVIWKDVALAGALLLATGLIYWAWNSGKRWPLSLAAVLLFYGAAARLNAAGAVAPLAFWLAYVGIRSTKYKADRKTVVLAGAGLLAVLAGGAFAVNRYLTRGASTYPMQLAYLYDLAAISTSEGRSLFPAYVNESPGFSMEQVTLRYNTRSVNDLIYDGVPSPADRAVLPLTDDEERARELAAAWRSGVAGHPFDWAMHRAAVFAQLIGLRASVTAPYWEQGSASSPAEFRGSETVPHRVGMAYLGLFRRPFTQTFFFRAFLWLSVGALLLYRAIKGRFVNDTGLIVALLTSALAYAGSFILIAPSTEFRYLLWPAVASAVAIVFALTGEPTDRGIESNPAVI